MKTYSAYNNHKMFFTGQTLYLQNYHKYEVLPDHYKEVPYEDAPRGGMDDLFESADHYQPGMLCYMWCGPELNVMRGGDYSTWRPDEERLNNYDIMMRYCRTIKRKVHNVMILFIGGYYEDD